MYSEFVTGLLLISIGPQMSLQRELASPLDARKAFMYGRSLI